MGLDLNEETVFLQQSADVEHLLPIIMENISDFMDAERSTLFLYDEQKNELWSEVAQGDKLSEIRIAANAGIAGHVMQTGETVNIEDAYRDDRFNPEFDKQNKFKTKTILCQPVKSSDGRRIGVVQVLNKRDGLFTVKDEKLLSVFTRQAAITIENAQLFDKVTGLKQELDVQHGKLQKAYLNIEKDKSTLTQALNKIKMSGRLGAGFLILLVGITAYVYLTGKITEFDTAPEDVTENIEINLDDIITVSTGPVQATLTLAGMIEPLGVVNIISPIEGKVISKSFKYGEHVEKGQEIIKIETSKVLVSLRQARAQYIKALEQFNKLKNWKSGSEVTRSKRAIAKMRYSLEKSKRTLAETERLYEMGIIPASEKDSAQEQYDNLILESKTTQEELQSILKQGGKDHLEIAELEFENAKFELDELEKQIKNANVVAEVSGIVIFPAKQGGDKSKAKMIEKGTSVSIGEILISIADLEGLSVKTKVDEVDINQIQSGQKVTVTGDAFANTPLYGKITYISSQAKSESGSIPLFDITVTINDIDPEIMKGIRLGMSSKLVILTYERSDAILLPFNAVRTVGDQSFVNKLDNETQQPIEVPIKTGIVTGIQIEILDGISVDDQIIIQTNYGY